MKLLGVALISTILFYLFVDTGTSIYILLLYLSCFISFICIVFCEADLEIEIVVCPLDTGHIEMTG